MGVSKNRGTLKSSIFTGFSIINHPFWDTPIFGNIHMCIFTTARNFWYSRSRLQWRLFFSHQQYERPQISGPGGSMGTGDFLVGGFKYILFSSLFGEMIQFDYIIWANYNDVSRRHPKWWFNKGTSPKSP